MKLYKISLIVFAMLGLALTACDPQVNPDQPEVIPASFPRKHLIEEFTSQSCGYCPAGMDNVHNFMGADDDYVLVLHHAGYYSDRYTINESSQTASKLKVGGAPYVNLDRAQAPFSPSNLARYKKQLADTTYASVNIKNKYYPNSGQLSITVSGVVITNDHPDLRLTVLIKESGMIGAQSDYYNTTNGWKEFRHVCAAREYLTDFQGDTLEMTDANHYEMHFVTALDDTWVPENCMVVAFLTEGFQPVVQANQQPVVEGTKGGSDILHGGITKY